jgi:hypothetical protein
MDQSSEDDLRTGNDAIDLGHQSVNHVPELQHISDDLCKNLTRHSNDSFKVDQSPDFKIMESNWDKNRSETVNNTVENNMSENWDDETSVVNVDYEAIISSAPAWEEPDEPEPQINTHIKVSRRLGLYAYKYCIHYVFSYLCIVL